MRASGSGTSYRVSVHRCCIDSRNLFLEGNQVWIYHDGETHQLRQTRNGELILTK